MYTTSPLDPQDGPKRCSACMEGQNGEDEKQTPVFECADSLWAHIATVHTLWIPFECILCPMMFLPTEGVLKRHYEDTHPGKVQRAIYTYVKKKTSKIRQIFLESQRLSDSSDSNCSSVNNTSVISKSKANSITTGMQRKTSSDVSQIDDSLNQRPAELSEVIMFDDEEEQVANGIEEEESMDEQANGLNSTQSAEIDQIFQNVDWDQFEESVSKVSHSQINLKQEGGKAIDKMKVKQEKKRNRNYKTKAAHGKIARKVVSKQTSKSRRPRTLKLTKTELTWCNLCQTKVASATNIGPHVWSYHMDGSKRFSCKHCSHGTLRANLMKAHIEKKHRGRNGIGWIDHTADLKQQYLRQHEAAVGQAQSGQQQTPSSSKRKTFIDCQLCARSVPRIHRNHHIWRLHMSTQRYTCHQCGVGESEMKNLTLHMCNAGLGGAYDNAPSWRDNAQALSAEYEKVFVDAFGERESLTNP